MGKGWAIVISSENGRVFKKMDRARAPFRKCLLDAEHVTVALTVLKCRSEIMSLKSAALTPV